MTVGQLILYLLIGTPAERADFRMRMKNFCERHLIADDPYDEQTRKFREQQEKQKREDSDEP